MVTLNNYKDKTVELFNYLKFNNKKNEGSDWTCIIN